jgi:hypothetical protein
MKESSNSTAVIIATQVAKVLRPFVWTGLVTSDAVVPDAMSSDVLANIVSTDIHRLMSGYFRDQAILNMRHFMRQVCGEQQRISVRLTAHSPQVQEMA